VEVRSGRLSMSPGRGQCLMPDAIGRRAIRGARCRRFLEIMDVVPPVGIGAGRGRYPRVLLNAASSSVGLAPSRYRPCRRPTDRPHVYGRQAGGAVESGCGGGARHRVGRRRRAVLALAGGRGRAEFVFDAVAGLASRTWPGWSPPTACTWCTER
jgi:hypothetical protein